MQRSHPVKHFIATVFGERLIPRSVKAVAVVAVCMALTFVLLSEDPWSIFRWVPVRPKTDLPDRIPDKVYHFCGYFGLSLTCMWYAASRAKWVVAGLIAFMIGHAGMTEYLQGFVPDRTTDGMDFVANCLGIATGFALGLLGRRAVETDDPEPILWATGNRLPDASPTSVKMPVEQSALPPAPGGTPELFVMQSGRVVQSLDEEGRVPSSEHLRQREMSRQGIGLQRNEIDAQTVKDWQTRVINYRFLGIGCITLAVLLGTTYGLHAWQVNRNSGLLLKEGKEAWAAGDLKKARGLYSRYVALRPSDLHAYADYGVLIDLTRSQKRGAGHVFSIFEDVLRADPILHDVRRRQVKVAMELGRYTDALAHLKVLRQLRSNDGQLDLLAGQCYEGLAEFTEAKEAYQRGIDHSPDLVECYRRLAQLEYQRFEDQAASARLLSEMVSRNEKQPTAWLARAQFLQETGQLEAAQEDLGHAIEMAPEDPDVLLAAAHLASARIVRARADGRPALVGRIVAQTKSLLEKGVAVRPDHIELELRLVMFESHFGDHESALARLETILAERPKESRAHLLLADLAIERGDFERAKRSIDVLPRSPQVDALRLFLQGRITMAEQRWDAAVAVLLEARRYLADDPQMLERVDLALARAHAALNQSHNELDAYRSLLKHNPTSLVGRLGLAAALVKTQQLPEAIVEYRQLAHLSQVRLELARLLLVQNLKLPELNRDWREVEQLLDEARKQGDDPVFETLLRAELLAGRGLLLEARQLLETTRQSQGDRVEYLAALARLSDQKGDRQQAAHWLGQAWAAVGNSPEAEAALRKAIELSTPGQEGVQGRLALLHLYLRQERRAEASELFQQIAPKLSLAELARTYASFGDLGRSVSMLQQELNVRPSNHEALRTLADVFLGHGHSARAEPLLRKLIDPSVSPSALEAAKARRQLAVLLASKREHRATQEALVLLDANAAAEANNFEDLRARAAVLSTMNGREDRAAAIRLLEQLDDQSLLLPKDRWLLGRLYDEDGQSEAAGRHFESVLAQVPDRTAYLLDFVSHQLDEQHVAAAEKWLQKLQAIAGSDPRTQRLRARWLALKGEHAQVIASLKEFVNSATASKLKHSRLVLATEITEELARQSGDSERLRYLAESENFMKSLAEQDPAHVESHVAWLVRQGRDVDAFGLQEVLWKSVRPEVAAGVSLSLLSSPRAAVTWRTDIERRVVDALSKSPKSVPLKLCLADLRSLQGQYETAEGLYRQVLNGDRENVLALNNLAWLLAMQSEHLDEAQMLIERAVGVAGPVPQLLDTRSCVWLAQHNLSRAITDARTANESQPSASGWLHLAAAYSSNGDLEEARTALSKALAAQVDTPSLHPLERKQLEAVKEKLAVSRASK